MIMNGRQQMEQPHARISRKVKVLFVVFILNGLVPVHTSTRIAGILNLRLVAFVCWGNHILVEPSGLPSLSPSTSTRPSIKPSNGPSSLPSIEPTSRPSIHSSSTPSLRPTKLPSKLQIEKKSTVKIPKTTKKIASTSFVLIPNLKHF
jgi:hypothetical protein